MMQKKLDNTLKKIANDFSHNDDGQKDIFQQINKLFFQYKKEGKELAINALFCKLQEKDEDNYSFLIQFAEFCLNNEFGYIGKELVYFCIMEELEIKNKVNFINIITDIILHFNLEEYLSLDNAIEKRIRFSIEDKSQVVKLELFSIDKQLEILKKIYYKVFRGISSTDDFDKVTQLIKNYSKIIDIIRSYNKDILKEYKFFHIFSKENYAIFDKNNSYINEIDLFEKFDVFLFPSFEDFYFKEKRISTPNIGDGYVDNPTLEIYHEDNLLVKVKNENTFYSGETCTFSLDDYQYSKLIELNPNGKPIILIIIFEKYNKIFKFKESIKIEDFLKDVDNKKSDKSDLLMILINLAARACEKKYDKKIENLHNDFFVDGLRNEGYSVSDQTRSGRSSKGNDAGEIDIMIRKNDSGAPISIIEAFKLDSVGEKNKIVSEHIKKLLYDYDTVGHEKNYILVYAEARNFENLWENYIQYMEKIDSHIETLMKENPIFKIKYPLIEFKDTEKHFSDKAGIRVGLAKHKREGYEVEVFHIFMDLSIDS